jgi:hypothetical protein
VGELPTPPQTKKKSFFPAARYKTEKNKLKTKWENKRKKKKKKASGWRF